MASELRGILSALCTPFGTGGAEIDEDRLRRLVEWNIDSGVHGLIPCGSTGEFASLVGAERMRVTEIVADQAAGRVPMIPQTGCTSMRQTIELSQHAQRCGAAAVMVVFPFYEPISLDEIFIYYRCISEAIDIPIMVYNSPSGTKKNLPPSFLAQMGREIRNVKYLKDSSASLAQLKELVFRHSKDIVTFNGWDTTLYSGFMVGCAGAVMGPANVIPKECAAVYELVTSGKVVEARELYRRIWPVMQFIEENRYNAAIKAGARLVGHDVGEVRPPFQPLEPSKVQELRRTLVEAGVIPA